MISDSVIKRCETLAATVRKDIIGLADVCGGDLHWGSALSCVEALCVLYDNVLHGDIRSPFPERDKFILSKGHAAAALYAVMAETNRMPKARLMDFQKNGEPLMELTVMNKELGIECSGGSLGLGLSMGVGLALLAKRKTYSYQTYVMVGDGECNEGSIWEAAMSAVQFKLNNLMLVVDGNGLQSDGVNREIMSVENIAQRLVSFGWAAVEVPGHDIGEVAEAFHKTRPTDKPYAVVLKTIKGKGVSFMEGEYTWHHRILAKEELELAKKEVGLI